MADIDGRFRAAARMQMAGELAQAERLYRGILEEQPSHLPALSRLGIVLHRQGNGGATVDTYRRYLQHQPGDSAIQGNLGLALRDTSGAIGMIKRSY